MPLPPPSEEEIVPEIPANPELEHLIVQSEENHQEMMSSLDTLIQQGEENNPESILEASLVTQDALLEEAKATKQVQEKMLSKLENLTAEETTVILRGHQGKQGEKGEKGDKGDTPEKGKDYFTAEEVATFKKEVTPVKGVDYVDGKDGINGKDGLDGKDAPPIDEDKIIASVVSQIPTPKNGEKGDKGDQGSPDTAQDIAKKVNTLKEEISFNVLKDIPLFLRTRQASRDYSFLELTDTPKNYTGYAGNSVRVKSDESGLEFTPSDAGDVIGPASSTDNAVARFDGTTGKLIQNSSIIISDAGAVTGVTALTISSFTAGSVLFAGTGGLISQDNANFFWDDTNNRLGIGTAAPTVSMEVKVTNSNGSFTDIQKYSTVDTASGRQDVITFSGGATSNRGMKINVAELTSGGVDTGFGNSGFVFLLNEVRTFHEGAYPLTFYTSNAERVRIDSSGNVGIGNTNPSYKLDIAGSTNGALSAIKIRNSNAGSSAYSALYFFNDDGVNAGGLTMNSSTLTTEGGVNSINLFNDAGAITVKAAASTGIYAKISSVTALTVTSAYQVYAHYGLTVGGKTATTAPGFGNRLRLDQTDGTNAASVIEFYNGSHSMYWFLEGVSTGGRAQIRTDSTRAVVLQDNATSGQGFVGVGTPSPTAKLHIVSAAGSSGTVKSFRIDGASHTGQTASTEISNFLYNTYTRTWAAGAITTQREVLFSAPTYAFASASTITNAATFAISAAPIAGTNATITNPYALWVQAGTSRLDGLLDLSGISAGSPSIKITATSDTPATTWTAGVPSNNPTGYMEINVGGTSYYIPYWA